MHISKKNVQDAYNLIKECIDQQLEVCGVEWEVREDAPSTYKTMIESYKTNKKFIVFGGGDHGVLGREYNIKFRALHDYMHLNEGLTFSFKDEKLLSDLTVIKFKFHAEKLVGCSAYMAALVGKIIDREIRGQVEYYEKHREYVEDQTEFIMELVNC